MTARVALVDQLGQEDRYDLVVVAMQRRSRIAVCPELARNPYLKSVLFLGNASRAFTGTSITCLRKRSCWASRAPAAGGAATIS